MSKQAILAKLESLYNERESETHWLILESIDSEIDRLETILAHADFDENGNQI